MKKYNNNDFTINNVNEKVELYGFVSKTRNLGGVIFIDLRDRSGIIQLVIRPNSPFFEKSLDVKNEYVLKVEGIILERENKNYALKTGEIEVDVTYLEILNKAIDLPIDISVNSNSLEDTRLKYRYLDIRRDDIKNNLILRHKVLNITRNYFDSLNFIEVETPILSKSTPEGARDYIVPSRVNKSKFYALPQSPQIYKQLLMVGGIEKYFQIARCFRDEDLRADRQPEFSQIDVEMSYIEEKDIQNITENLLVKIFKEVKNIELKTPFMRMKYDDAIDIYGSDKPDTRFDMKLINFSDVFKDTDFTLFKDILENKGIINGIVVKNLNSELTRKVLDEFSEFVKIYKALGISYLKYNDNNFESGISKFLSEQEKNEILDLTNLEDNDTIIFVAGSSKIVKNALGALRCHIAKKYDLIDNTKYNFLWVVDFPLFEYSEEDKRYYAMHHPFTSPKLESVDALETDRGNCYARAYDIVLNGYELGGGSIRIHDSSLQEKMFHALGIEKEEQEEKFGFLINAFKYGTPPHGGIALGVERLIMLLSGTENIRDVIAFPKTATASCLMMNAPSAVTEEQLDELKINLK